MEKEIIDNIMYNNFLKSVPTMVVDTKDRKTISAYGSIDVDDLTSAIDRFDKVPEYGELLKENKKLKDKLSKIETLIINHNCDTGDIYYKYNSRFLKSELKQRILEIIYEVSE